MTEQFDKLDEQIIAQQNSYEYSFKNYGMKKTKIDLGQQMRQEIFQYLEQQKFPDYRKKYNYYISQVQDIIIQIVQKKIPDIAQMKSQDFIMKYGKFIHLHFVYMFQTEYYYYSYANQFYQQLRFKPFKRLDDIKTFEFEKQQFNFSQYVCLSILLLALTNLSQEKPIPDLLENEQIYDGQEEIQEEKIANQKDMERLKQFLYQNREVVNTEQIIDRKLGQRMVQALQHDLILQDFKQFTQKFQQYKIKAYEFLDYTIKNNLKNNLIDINQYGQQIQNFLLTNWTQKFQINIILQFYRVIPLRLFSKNDKQVQLKRIQQTRQSKLIDDDDDMEKYACAAALMSVIFELPNKPYPQVPTQTSQQQDLGIELDTKSIQKEQQQRVNEFLAKYGVAAMCNDNIYSQNFAKNYMNNLFNDLRLQKYIGAKKSFDAYIECAKQYLVDKIKQLTNSPLLDINDQQHRKAIRNYYIGYFDKQFNDKLNNEFYQYCQLNDFENFKRVQQTRLAQLVDENQSLNNYAKTAAILNVIESFSQ